MTMGFGTCPIDDHKALGKSIRARDQEDTSLMLSHQDDLETLLRGMAVLCRVTSLHLRSADLFRFYALGCGA